MANIWSRFRKPEPPIVQIGHPIVVLSKEMQLHDVSAWRTVGEIRPSESSWSMGQWLPKQTTRLIPDVTQIPGWARFLASAKSRGEPSTFAESGHARVRRRCCFADSAQWHFSSNASGPDARLAPQGDHPISGITDDEIAQSMLPAPTTACSPAVSFVLASDANTDEPSRWKTSLVRALSGR